jgi:2-iminobutanoate/2-iminopropanoate deaminase
MTKHKIAVSTVQAPAAIGPYSQAIRFGDFMFLSGQIALDPATGALVPGGVEAQTEQVMKNLEAVLQSQGLGFGNLIKTTVFLKTMADFPKFNEIYAKYLREPFPARATIAVAGLPKEAVVEIEAIAHVS